MIFTAHASMAGGGDEQPTPDLHALNSCIAAAIDTGATWPRSPVKVLNQLFSLSPDCVLPAAGSLGQGEGVAADSSVVLVFRHVLPGRPMEGQWLEARLTTEIDGTWRVRMLTPYQEARAGEVASQREILRLNELQFTGFDIDLGPIALLQFLKERRGAWMAPVIPSGWIKDADLAALVGMLDSTEPCAGVINMFSSVIDTSTSTVGNEAAYLLEGYIVGRYPPRLVSTRPRCDVRAMKLWWNKRHER